MTAITNVLDPTRLFEIRGVPYRVQTISGDYAAGTYTIVPAVTGQIIAVLGLIAASVSVAGGFHLRFNATPSNVMGYTPTSTTAPLVIRASEIPIAIVPISQPLIFVPNQQIGLTLQYIQYAPA